MEFGDVIVGCTFTYNCSMHCVCPYVRLEERECDIQIKVTDKGTQDSCDKGRKTHRETWRVRLARYTIRKNVNRSLYLDKIRSSV